MDWTSDSRNLQSVDLSGSFRYWDATAGVQVLEHVDRLRGTPWASWTCKGGWAVSGLKTKFTTGITGEEQCVRGAGVTTPAVCRSNRADVVAAVDEFGLVQCEFRALSFADWFRLYTFPAVAEDMRSKRYAGHSSKVANVRFSFDDSILITVGGTDRCGLAGIRVLTRAVPSFNGTTSTAEVWTQNLLPL